jgi:cytidine deaminase
MLDNMEYKELVEEAFKAKERSLPTYSGFHVGAALLTKDGKVYLGGNIENSSYGLTVCAERVAAFKAVFEGEKEFEAIAVASDAEDFIPPCGACRQVLIELCGKDMDVISTNSKKETKIIKIKELIPFSFGEDYLK